MKHILSLLALGLITLSIQAQTITLPPHGENEKCSLMSALEQRQTIRNLLSDELPLETVSNLLWAAYGYNRPDAQKRTAPSARNIQEMDIYLFNKEGIYLYDAERNTLQLVTNGDYRATISSQEHFAVAPVSIVIVANYDRMKGMNEEARNFYAPLDAGYVSQNIYLYCASANLGTVACGGIDRDNISKLLKVKNGKVILAHPVGFSKKK